MLLLLYALEIEDFSKERILVDRFLDSLGSALRIDHVSYRSRHMDRHTDLAGTVTRIHVDTEE